MTLSLSLCLKNVLLFLSLFDRSQSPKVRIEKERKDKDGKGEKKSSSTPVESYFASIFTSIWFSLKLSTLQHSLYSLSLSLIFTLKHVTPIFTIFSTNTENVMEEKEKGIIITFSDKRRSSLLLLSLSSITITLTTCQELEQLMERREGESECFFHLTTLTQEREKVFFVKFNISIAAHFTAPSPFFSSTEFSSFLSLSLTFSRCPPSSQEQQTAFLIFFCCLSWRTFG